MARIPTLLSGLLLFACGAVCAQDGYVVRVDSSGVFLDITQSSVAAKTGAGFAVYTEGDEIANPVTGVNLGKVRVTIASGTVTEVTPRYAVGRLDWQKSEVKPGQFFKWQDQVPMPSADKVVWQSDPLDYSAVALALGGFSAAGAGEIAVASQDTVRVYVFGATGMPEERFVYKPGGMYRILSLDAADLRGKNRDQLFVSVYDAFTGAFQTIVLEAGDKLQRTATLGWLSRAVSLPDGTKRLYGQQFFSTGELRRSQVRRVVYTEGSYSLDGNRLKMREPGSLYGLAILDEAAGEPTALAYIADSGQLKIRKMDRDSKTEIPGDYAITANMLTIADSGTLRFDSRLPSGRLDGRLVIYAATLPARGLVPNFFTGPGDALLRRLWWNGKTFIPSGDIALGGHICDIDSGFAGAPGTGVVVCVTGVDGKTVIKLVR